MSCSDGSRGGRDRRRHARERDVERGCVHAGSGAAVNAVTFTSTIQRTAAGRRSGCVVTRSRSRRRAGADAFECACRSGVRREERDRHSVERKCVAARPGAAHGARCRQHAWSTSSSGEYACAAPSRVEGLASSPVEGPRSWSRPARVRAVNRRFDRARSCLETSKRVRHFDQSQRRWPPSRPLRPRAPLRSAVAGILENHGKGDAPRRGPAPSRSRGLP